jgi:hypothetical protein
VADRDEGLIAHLPRMGSRLRQGIAEEAAAHGVKLRQSGPVQMPLILFGDDPQYEKGIAFCAEALQRGVYLHPRHNMFLWGAWGEGNRSGVGGDGGGVWRRSPAVTVDRYAMNTRSLCQRRKAIDGRSSVACGVLDSTCPLCR